MYAVERSSLHYSISRVSDLTRLGSEKYFQRLFCVEVFLAKAFS